MATRWLLGVDVSKWQGDIQWDKLAQKAAFAFIKATQATFTDPKFERNWKESQKRILRGAYHFLDPETNPKAQAEFFIKTLKEQGDIGELPPVLDVEKGPVTWNDIQTWMDTVEQALGRTPILYTSPGFAKPLGPPPKLWPLWVAHYQQRKPTLPPGWSHWTFWQFTDRGNGKDYGVQSGFIDLNWFQGNWVSLVRFCLGMTPPEEPVTPHEEEEEGEGELPQKYRITAYRLRVRAGPGTQYATVGGLVQGTIVEVDQVVEEGAYAPWGRIGPKRWISLRYAEPVEGP